jgi:hypothetical protein
MTDEIRQVLVALRRQQESLDRLIQLVAERLPAPAERPAADGADPADAAGPEPQKRRPIDWGTLSGPERVATWRGLGAFVEDMVHRYQLHFDIMPCWWRHRDAVELLTVMWLVYETSTGPDSDAQAALAWQDTYHRCVDRLKGYFISCRDGHLDAHPIVWFSDAVRGQFEEMARTDTAGTGQPTVRS